MGGIANAMVVIILQYVSVSINTLYTLNLHNVMYQLYLNKAGGKNVNHTFLKNYVR